jgi:pimeloyl-ACP methyl ester carboxylesterase
VTGAPGLSLVLLPGLLCDRALWNAQIAALASLAAISVIDISPGESMAAMAELVLQQAPDAFALAGLSMGGYVAFEIMRRAPERVQRLALLDTSARADTPEQMAFRETLIRQAQIGDFKGVTPRLLSRWIHPARLDDRALVDDVLSMTQRAGREAFIRNQLAIMGRPDSRPGLSRIACQTLVLCGRQDQSTPLEYHREIATDIKQAHLVVVEDCGHLSTMERPEAVNAALRDWLART